MKTRSLALAVMMALGGTVAAQTPQMTSERNTMESNAIAHLMAVNEHEILSAEIAAGKQVSAPVAEYAAMLKREHAENQALSAKLATAPKKDANDSADVIARKEKAAAERQMLSATPASEFEAIYLDAMIDGHAEALTLIDDKLMPAAKTSAVKSHLTETRKHIAMHLERAEALQAD